MNREEKLASFKTLSKLSGLKTGRQFEEESVEKARLLIDHPAAGRAWKIEGPDSVPGFWHLETSTPIGRDFFYERMSYQRFELVLFEAEFERIQ
jgi:hypothetical protein